MANNIVPRPEYPCGSFEDYNERGNHIEDMKISGWTIFNQSGERILISRPGVTDKSSANYHTGFKIIYFHTTSTDFEAKGYTPSRVFSILKCGGDDSKASKMLYDMGYGTKADYKPNLIESNHDPTVITAEEKLKYELLFAPMTEDQLMEYYKNKTNDIYSGFMIKGQRLNYLSGLISVLSGLPGHGKTTFMLNSSVTISNKYEVAYYGLEENRGLLIPKALSIYIGSNSEQQHYPLSEHCKSTIDMYFKTSTLKHLSSDKAAHFKHLKDRFFKEHIDNGRLKILTEKQKLDDMLRSIYYLKAYTDVKIIFVDYIQKLYTENRFHTRAEELAKICHDLEEAADKTGFAMVLGSQFNREVGAKNQVAINKAGGATEIEQTAKQFVSVWDEDAPQNKNDEKPGEAAKPKNQMTIQILKNNFGQTVGMKETLFFDGNTGVIRNNDEVTLALKGKEYLE
jgi:hypothetical protein